MAWSDKTTLGNLNTSLSEISNSDADYVAANHASEYVTLNPGESAVLQIETLFDSTGANVFWRIMATLDDSSENVDNVAYISGYLPFSAAATLRKTVLVSGVYKFRVEVRKGGTTAGAYTPNVYMRKNGANIV